MTVADNAGAIDSALSDHLRRREMQRAAEEAEIDEFRKFIDREPVSRDVPKAPLILRIEVTNLCNANCIFCTYQFQQREIQTISFDTVKLAVDQYAALGGQRISFTPVVGDSLIDRNLEQKVAYARSFPQFENIEIWTNAILLTRQRFEALVEAGVSDFYISMSGFNAQEYKNVYRNSGYAKVLSNLMDIARSPMLKKVGFVVWSRTTSATPELEPDYLKLREVADFPVVFRRGMFSWHGQIAQEDLSGEMFIIDGPPEQNRPCFHMWAAFTLMSDGEMTLCGCTDRDGAGLGLGNIRDYPINAHLTDGRWLEMRENFSRGCPPEFCRGCDMYLPVTMAEA